MNAKTLLISAVIGALASSGARADAVTRTWTGAGDDAKASTAANWTPEGAPETGDALVLNGDTATYPSANKAMSWDLTTVEPASWTQTSGYTGIVTLNTVSTVGGYNALVVTGGMDLQGGEIRCANAGASGDQIVGLDVRGNLTVGANAIISTTCRGMSTLATGRDATHHTGTSHGGLGGVGSYSYTDCTPCYGSIYNPATCGSEPGNGDRTWGGGVIKLTVGGTLTVEGAISSSAFNSPWNGGGSGGSVNITAGAIAGTGSGCGGSGGIWAQGPYRWYSTREISGGGGRIAITLTGATATFASFTGKIGARGMGAYGTPNNFTTDGSNDDLTPARGQYYFHQFYDTMAYSGAGTVYLREKNAAQNAGTLVVDQMRTLALTHAQAYTEINATMSPDLRYGAILIRNGGRLKVRDGVTVESVTVENDTTVPGLLDNDATGIVKLVGDADGNAYLKGNVTFTQLVVDTTVTTLYLQSGCDVSVSGRLVIKGSEGHPVNVKSSVAGTVAYLVLAADAESDLDYLAVTDIDASKGKVLQPKHSTGNDASIGWIFKTVVPGETITWTGAASDNWSDKANWDLGRAPVATDRIVIPVVAGGTYPVMPAVDVTLSHLTVAEGASVTLPDYTVTLTNGLSCAGTIVSSTSAYLVFDGDVTIAGTAAVNRVEIAAGTECRFADAAKLVVNDRLAAEGTSLAGITLAPSEAGKTWTLEMVKTSVGFSRIGYATIVGCRATGGTLYPQDSTVTDSVNVDTETTVQYWTGGTSDDPAVAANWYPAQVPGTDALLAIDAAETAYAPRFNAASGQNYAALSLVAGTMTADRPIVVTGDVRIGHGTTLTHTALPSTDDKAGESYRVDLTVGGDMVVEESATIDLVSKGYQGGKGPGAYYGNYWYASYGGGVTMFAHSDTPTANCYGSIFAPTNAGSGGHPGRSGEGTAYVGGGAVSLAVTGMLTLDGDILTKPYGWQDYFSAAGGGVSIRAGEIAGAGDINVQGGWTTTGGSSGGGGRIAIVLTKAGATFADYAGTMTAYGGSCGIASSTMTDSHKTDAASGTIYTKAADAALGTILVENQQTLASPMGAYTDLGFDADSSDLVGADLVLGRNARVRLLDDVTLGDLSSIAATATLYLNGHTLTVDRRKRRDIAALVGTRIILDGGTLKWRNLPTLLMVK